MRDPFTWSIHLGRWSGVRVRVHVLLIIFVLFRLLDASLAETPALGSTAAWLLLLLLALGLHEAAHAIVSRALELDPEEVNLWPLGNLTPPGVPSSRRGPQGVIAASAGLISSGTLALVAAVVLNLSAQARMVFNPFGLEQGGAPLLADGKSFAQPFSLVWFIGWFGYLNWVLFLVNLIPALPMDMGRVLRGLLGSPWGVLSRDQLVGPWTARACSLLLCIGGLIRLALGYDGGLSLIMLGIFLYLMARIESRSLEEGGFFDEPLFGYDFSEGYTSLEPEGPSAPVIRREGALARWRRRRSEQRRLRQAAKEAAEEQRMDEILDKIHREGRSSLSGEENRFLMRVSHKYRSRSRSRD